MPAYKLTYFNGRGTAEIVRLVFAAAGIEYEDVRIEKPEEQWPELKPKTPMGQVPILEVDGTMLCQSNSIARYVAKVAGLAGKTPLDQARVDMIMDGMDDVGKKGNATHWEKDEEKKVTTSLAWYPVLRDWGYWVVQAGCAFGGSNSFPRQVQQAVPAEKKKEYEETFLPQFYTCLNKLVGDSGYFVGNELTLADITFFNTTTLVGNYFKLPNMDDFSGLKKVMDHVTSNPGIAKWLKERPETPDTECLRAPKSVGFRTEAYSPRTDPLRLPTFLHVDSTQKHVRRVVTKALDGAVLVY
ncbi:hypothetical protein Bbelb_016090 [Branchiostoma belcheri]|nr:hypothetical protein Bbelb_016090 [Branchiostoma belcheri]